MAIVVQCFILVCSLWLVAVSASIFSRQNEYVLMADVQENDWISAAFINSKSARNPENRNNGILLHVNQQGFKVKSLKNKHLVAMQVLNDRQSQFIQILDTGFIQFHGKDYVIPHHLLAKAQQLTEKEDIKAFIDKLKHSASIQSAEKGFKSAMHRLASAPESRPILQACEALGNEGITGASHPQMLPLYVFATRLPHAARLQMVRQPLPQEWANQQCSVPRANECLGMCGYGCQCWKLFCGDCCYHQGCYEHDVCCRHQYYSSYCLTPFPYGFGCQRFGGYPTCTKSGNWWGK